MVVPEAKGAQEAVLSSPSVPKTMPFGPQAGVSDSTEGLVRDIGEANLPSSSPIANPSNAPMKEPQFSQTMAEDDNTLHNLIPDILKTLGLSDDITEPSISTDMNLVEELDTTLEDTQNLWEQVNVKEELA
ncbi:hypothetical protein F0562_012692 [Nyssa sinensis]|uniref:Uncharacterized protein n=1 Tax=Nyssa sinensis TaxID=561372 RepID=A0A5J4ZVW7_9ASTE|nr:hypothetical protein F0562_012692 [Nyssa sinensis]